MPTTTTDRLFDAIRGVDGAWREIDETDDLVELWCDAEYAMRQLGQVIKLLADAAGGRLLDRDDPMADYVTRAGNVVHLAKGYASERWQGREVVSQLAVPLADRLTGEIVPAVPLDVLCDVVPGCATPELTSSRWRVGGLKRHLPEWRRYRSRDAAPLVIRRGSGER